MKTAMQELIELLKIEENSISDNDSYEDRCWRNGVRCYIKKAIELLEKEKQQIENAYRDGLVASRYNGNENTEEYYYNLYNQSIKKITITENNNQPNL